MISRFFVGYLLIEVASFAAIAWSWLLQILKSKLTLSNYFAGGAFGVVGVEAGATSNVACSSTRINSFLDVAATAAANVFP